MNLLLQSWSGPWLAVLWRASVQGALAILLVMATVVLLARIKAPAWVEHWLWKLVYLKFLLALLITHPIALPVLAPPEATSVTASNQSIAATTPVTAALPDRGLLPATQPTTDRWVAEAASAGRARESAPIWQVALAGAWLLGVLANLLVLMRQLLATRRLQVVPVTDWRLIETCRELAESQGLRRVPKLGVSDRLSSPALVGWFRPAIVLPSETLRQCSAQQLRGVLGHELSHYRRADLWWNLLPAATQVLFYFHPLLWLANRRWRVSSEMACDAGAIETSVSSVAQYAESLLRIASLGSHRLQTQRCLGCVSVFDSSRSLKQRLCAMKDYQPSSARKIFSYAALITLVGLAGTLPWQLVSRAAEPNPRDSSGDNVGESTFGRNMNFEQKADNGQHAKHWGGGGQGYSLELDRENPHSGSLCARISGNTESGFGTYTQCVDATPLRGKRVQFSGYLRSDVQNDGGLWMRIDAGKQVVGFDNMQDRRVQGKTDWKQYEIVLDVPAEATGICFGFLIVGKGDLWADDFRIAVLDDADSGPKTTGVAPQTLQLPKNYSNMDFEQESDTPHQRIQGWGGGGRGYELSRDAQTKHSGGASGRIQRVKDDGTFGTFTQMFSADLFRGKRVRYTGFLKTDDAETAGLWMRVDGEGGKVLSFDNMNARPVTGSTDWKQYSVVLDVPEQSQAVALGFLISGGGTVWGDDLKLEVVGDAGKGPKSTAMSLAQPSDFFNGDFEKARGRLPESWGGGGPGYQLVRDTQQKHSGTACGRITKQSDAGAFGTFTQMFVADNYKGKRVRLSGFLKTKDAATAGLWMRIDGPGTSPLGFDNMNNRAVKGTTDWAEYSVVLDVPTSATHIALGFLLIGEGTAWGDDLKLEIVGNEGQGPDTTSML